MRVSNELGAISVEIKRYDGITDAELLGLDVKYNGTQTISLRY